MRGANWEMEYGQTLKTLSLLRTTEKLLLDFNRRKCRWSLDWIVSGLSNINCWSEVFRTCERYLGKDVWSGRSSILCTNNVLNTFEYISLKYFHFSFSNNGPVVLLFSLAECICLQLVFWRGLWKEPGEDTELRPQLSPLSASVWRGSQPLEEIFLFVSMKIFQLSSRSDKQTVLIYIMLLKQEESSMTVMIMVITIVMMTMI